MTGRGYPGGKGFVVWIKEHGKQLVLAGVGVAVLTTTILGILEDPEKIRNIVHQEYLNPKNDMDYINWCWSRMKRLTKQSEAKNMVVKKWFSSS